MGSGFPLPFLHVSHFGWLSARVCVYMPLLCSPSLFMLTIGVGQPHGLALLPHRHVLSNVRRKCTRKGERQPPNDLQQVFASTYTFVASSNVAVTCPPISLRSSPPSCCRTCRRPTSGLVRAAPAPACSRRRRHSTSRNIATQRAPQPRRSKARDVESGGEGRGVKERHKEWEQGLEQSWAEGRGCTLTRSGCCFD